MRRWPFVPVQRRNFPRFRPGGVSDWPEQVPIVEPIDPFENGELDGFDVPPRCAPVDHLSLVKSVDDLG